VQASHGFHLVEQLATFPRGALAIPLLHGAQVFPALVDVHFVFSGHDPSGNIFI
jgi:hypothetical protein